ncbi:hypothetical protein [Aureispira sp. CCB-QB1]|uniref:hypothetical protein n=1 Tax=Aureispira sp. CCB-QB1 TaxID=1313421 RepID=UPI0012DE600E|nr:hypothetical protein [Aureispira sp. CCB-QB1]
MASLRENSYWAYQGKQSDQKEKITLRNQEFNAYWYKIDIDNCVSGWVYGGAIEFIERPKDGTPNIAATIPFSEELIKDIGKEKHETIQQVIHDFDAISTAEALLDYYNTQPKAVAELLPSIAERLYEGVYDEVMLKCLLKIFTYTQLCSECSVELYIDVLAFLEKAKTTPAKVDDEIFQLLYDAVGEYNSFDVGALSEHDCDFCWHSILGDGQLLAFWKRVEKIRSMPASDLKLDNLMNELEQYLFLEMNSTTYIHSQVKVLKELEAIEVVLKRLSLPRNFMKGFEELKTQLHNQMNVTFDCANKDCATIVMDGLFPNH